MLHESPAVDCQRKISELLKAGETNPDEQGIFEIRILLVDSAVEFVKPKREAHVSAAISTESEQFIQPS